VELSLLSARRALTDLKSSQVRKIIINKSHRTHKQNSFIIILEQDQHCAAL
jgi:hypothetical protein